MESGIFRPRKPCILSANADEYDRTRTARIARALARAAGERRRTPGAALALVNDLDVAVTCGNYTFYCDGSDDHCDSLNNVERYRTSEFPDGSEIEIKVKGYNVMEGPQTFSLAVSGVDAVVVPEPAFALTALLITLLLGRKPNRKL
ncbi:MAG: hypothetical protein IK051_04855 [Rhodocyclaceae bacterium]|nr:hypothetical protein [Rhodocyclaceae bacterium]